MNDTNLDLAPPVAVVDDLTAVPIDVQRITANLTFDGATSSGAGDATLEFTMGPQEGNLIFDLRQTITAAWLDGAPLAPGLLAHHDFGGGPYAELRVVEALLAAGTTHTLRVTYPLGPPDSMMMPGGYPPAMIWSMGPRLTFNFGLSDLNAARYLEAWIPANLIFDQFELILEILILNTEIAHTPITNGTVTSLGFNHWSIAFPARYTALSPLLELRATDTLASMTGSVVMPSGATVTTEAWKLVTGSADLAAQIANLQAWLPANEAALGPYMHGNRFVTFFNVGGMEYEGGTTTAPNALQHETFHSWWARGIKPAAQADGWLDEGWATYYDAGAVGSSPFDYTEPTAELCSRNPWVRRTPGTSYAAGSRFWEGMAGLVTVANLKNWMNAFYAERRNRPARTTDVEEYLLCHSGNPQVVDGFHHFVYGFPDPASAPDLWLRDDPGHTGIDAWAGRFWDSPDLWVRNADDGSPIYQNPVVGRDNWFYARVRNRSATATARHFAVSFNVLPYAGTEFAYPADFLPCVAAATGFDLAPGGEQVVKARWPAALVPAAGAHACLVAAVLTRSDQPIVGRHVWEHNNLAQKNLTILALAPGEWIVVPFVVANLRARLARQFLLEVVRPANRPDFPVALIHRSESILTLAPERARALPEIVPAEIAAEPPELLDCGGIAGGWHSSRGQALAEVTTSRTDAGLAIQFPRGFEAPFAAGPKASIPVVLKRQEQLLVGLRLRMPADAQPGEVFRLDLVKRNKQTRRILGGIAIEVHVRDV